MGTTPVRNRVHRTSNNTLRSQPTVYNGRRYRSRLEARWAIFFDTLGVEFEYEREQFGTRSGLYYLPDFWLPHINGGCWVEIKGTEPTEVEHHKAQRLADLTQRPVYIFYGPMEGHMEAARSNGLAYPLDGEGGEGESGYRWCECPMCGNLGIQYDGRADRLDCKMCIGCAALLTNMELLVSLRKGLSGRTEDDAPSTEYIDTLTMDMLDGCPEHYHHFEPGCPRVGYNHDRGRNTASERLLDAYEVSTRRRFGTQRLIVTPGVP